MTYMLFTHVCRNRTAMSFFFSFEVFVPHTILVIVTREPSITVPLYNLCLLPE